MITELTRRLSVYVIIIGVISLVITFIFGEQTSSIIKTVNATVGNYTTSFKTIDFQNYLNNVSNAFGSEPIPFEDIIPQRQWQTGGSIVNWDPIFNNMALVFDWVYFPINLLLWVIRWLGWVLRGLCAVGGISVAIDEQGIYNSTIVEVLDFIINNFKIPYI